MFGQIQTILNGHDVTITINGGEIKIRHSNRKPYESIPLPDSIRYDFLDWTYKLERIFTKERLDKLTDL